MASCCRAKVDDLLQETFGYAPGHELFQVREDLLLHGHQIPSQSAFVTIGGFSQVIRHDIVDIFDKHDVAGKCLEIG